MSVSTLGALLAAGCRTQANVQALTAEAAAALPPAAVQEVNQFLAALLRESLIALGLDDIISDDTLVALVQAGCRGWEDVRALSAEAMAALPGGAAAEVAECLRRFQLRFTLHGSDVDISENGAHRRSIVS